MDFWVSLVVGRPLRVLAAVALVTLGAFAVLFDVEQRSLRLWIDPAIERLLPSDDPKRVFADRVRLQFAGDAPIFIAVGTEPGELVLSQRHLERVEAMTQRLAEIF